MRALRFSRKTSRTELGRIPYTVSAKTVHLSTTNKAIAIANSHVISSLTIDNYRIHVILAVDVNCNIKQMFIENGQFNTIT